MTDAVEFVSAVVPALDRLRPLARRWSCLEADAEDLLADVALRAWRFRDRFDPERGTMIGWMATILRNEAARRVTSVSEPVDDVAAEDADHLAWLRVRLAVERLPADQRAALLASLEHGPTEAAGLLGVPVGTVASRVHRATASLRAELS